MFDEDDLRRRADELSRIRCRLPARRTGSTYRSLVAVGFSNGANIASAMLLQRPDSWPAAVLLAAMVPYAEPPDSSISAEPW